MSAPLIFPRFYPGQSWHLASRTGRLPGRQRAGPSTPLDEIVMFYQFMLAGKTTEPRHLLAKDASSSVPPVDQSPLEGV